MLTASVIIKLNPSEMAIFHEQNSWNEKAQGHDTELMKVEIGAPTSENWQNLLSLNSLKTGNQEFGS